MTGKRLLLGQTLSFDADPFAVPPVESATHRTHGAILIKDGMIAEVGEDYVIFETEGVEIKKLKGD